MDIKVTHDGMLCIGNVSQALSEIDILDLFREHFPEELGDPEATYQIDDPNSKYVLLQVTEEGEETITNWTMIPRRNMDSQTFTEIPL